LWFLGILAGLGFLFLFTAFKLAQMIRSVAHLNKWIIGMIFARKKYDCYFDFFSKQVQSAQQHSINLGQ
jgi:hypothetical protein